MCVSCSRKEVKVTPNIMDLLYGISHGLTGNWVFTSSDRVFVTDYCFLLLPNLRLTSSRAAFTHNINQPHREPWDDGTLLNTPKLWQLNNSGVYSAARGGSVTYVSVTFALLFQKQLERFFQLFPRHLEQTNTLNRFSQCRSWAEIINVLTNSQVILYTMVHVSYLAAFLSGLPKTPKLHYL